MKKNFLIILPLLCLQICASAQKSAHDWFMEAQRFFDNKEYTKSLASYQYVVDHYPKSEEYANALYNTAVIYRNDNNFDKAIPIFKEIFNGSFGSKNRHATSNDIMDLSMTSTYSDLEFRASSELYSIYYEKEIYDSALIYFSQSTKYRPEPFCGNARAGSAMHDALAYADLYQKMKQPGKAFAKLLPYTFGTIAFEGNSAVFYKLRELFKTIPDVKVTLDKSLENMVCKSRHPYTEFYFTFLNEEIKVPTNIIDIETNEADKQKVIDAFKATAVYKLIQEN